jgi:nucleolar GTP-binding protein
VYHPYLTLHSEQCGYSLKAQCNLFRSIKPLFANKMVFVVLNKMDIKTFEELDQEMQTELEDLTKSGDVELLRASCATQDGVQEVKNLVCEKLLAERVSQKLKAGTSSSGALGSRLTEVMARIHVAQPMDGLTRETFIPEGIKGVKKYDKADPERRMLSKDEEEANGGAGVFNVDLKRDYLLADPSWKYDKIPEILDGKNVYDYIDPDIEAKMAALEEEEERLEKEGFYESDEDLGDESEEDVLQKAEYIREKHKLIRNEAAMRKSLKNRAVIPRKQQKKTFSKLEDHLDQLGVDTESIGLRGRSEVRESRGRSVTRSRAGTADPDAMDVDNASTTAKQRLRSQSHVRDRSVMATNRREDGIPDELMRTKAERASKLGQRKMNRMARQGEADRHVAAAMPKHLVSSALFVVILVRVVSNVCSFTPTVRWQAYDRQDAASLSSSSNLCGWQRRSRGNGVYRQAPSGICCSCSGAAGGMRWVTGVVAVVDQSTSEREAMLNGKGAGKRRREKKDYPWSLVFLSIYLSFLALRA